MLTAFFCSEINICNLYVEEIVFVSFWKKSWVFLTSQLCKYNYLSYKTQQKNNIVNKIQNEIIFFYIITFLSLKKWRLFTHQVCSFKIYTSMHNPSNTNKQYIYLKKYYDQFWKNVQPPLSRFINNVIAARAAQNGGWLWFS